MKKLLSLFLSTVMIFSSVPGVMAAEKEEIKQIHVSVNGGSSNSGTAQSPLDSLESARKMVESVKRANPDAAIEVIFHEGTYRFSETVNFTNADSGSSKEHPITYKAADGEKVYFKGSVEIDLSKIRPVEEAETLARLPSVSRGKVGYIDLAAQGIDEIGEIPAGLSMHRAEFQCEGSEIYLNDNRQTLARWPNGRDEYAQFASVVSAGGTGENGPMGGTFTTEDFRLKRWETAKDAWVAGFFAYDWLYERIKIADINSAKKQVTLANSAIYGLSMSYSHRYAVINLLEELDMPGEWYIDRDKKILYYYPERSLKDATMEMTTLKDGIISMTNVKNVNIEGITFSQTRGCGIRLYDKMENMTISNCIFENIGRYGIWQTTSKLSNVAAETTQKEQYAENGSINFHLTNNIFRSCGSRSFDIICGSRDSNEPSGCSVTNNYVYDIGAADRRSYGAYVSGVGVEIAYNTIHQVGFGIYFLGADMDIHHNEVYDIMNNMTDGGGIYTGRNFINRGNKVHHNYVHDVRQKNPLIKAELTHAVYLDDMDCGTEVYENILVGADTGVLINCGMSNNIHDNIVADCTNEMVMISTYNMGSSIGKQRMELQGKAALKLNGYSRYPSIKEDLDSGMLTLPARNTVVNNVGTGETDYSDMMRSYNTIGENYKIGEEEFVDYAGGDYRLKSTSEYTKITSAPTEDFDMKSIGIKTEGFGKNPMQSEGFKLTYPQNGLLAIDTESIVFDWQRPIGADRFRLIVAKDSELKDVVYDITTYETTYTLSGFENGQCYYWKVYAKNESLYNCEEYASLGVPYMFTVAKQFARDTTDLEALIIVAKAKLDEIEEGDEVGKYKIGTKKALSEKVEQAEEMLSTGGYSVEDEKNIISDIENIMNDDVFINGGFVDLGDFLADAENWACSNSQMMQLDSENKTLSVQTSGAHTTLGYKGIENVSRVLALSFKIKVDFGESERDTKWVAMGLRGASPTDAVWASGNDQYYMIMKEGSLEYQRNSGGTTKILETVENPNVKNNEWMDIDFGVVNLGNVGQLTILKINGQVAYQAVDSTEEMVLKKGTFQIMLSNGTAAEFKAADKELGSFDELVSEYTYKMTKDFCTELEGYNGLKAAVLRSGSKKAYYNGDLHDVDIPITGEWDNMQITKELAAAVFGGTISDGNIIINSAVYQLPPQSSDGTINLKQLAEAIGKQIYFHNDQQLAFISDAIDMHTANYGRTFNGASNSLALYK